MDFLDTIESIRTEEASAQRIFRGEEGQSIRGLRRTDPRYLSRLAEAAGFIAEVMQGKRPAYHLKETMTTSDFPLLFGDILDRQLLGAYQEVPYSWNQVARRRTVPDFRTVRRFTIDGGEAVLEPVPEQTEYPAASLSEGKYDYSVKKYGRRMPFSWESMINDDLDALRDIPERLGRSARRTEERFVTDLYFDSNGPDATFIAAGNDNLMTGNPALSITSLAAAMTLLAGHTDSDGEPISVEMMTLWVPPALEIAAQQIANAVQLEIGDTSSATVPRLITTNWMRSRFRIAVGYYIPQIVTTGSRGNTSWMLVGNPAVGRPAAEIGFLRGHETPEVWVKSANAQRAGGGIVDAMDGDFDTDSIQYRIRHVLGGTLMDPKAAVGSNGSGS
jgi:hypothetical protein